MQLRTGLREFGYLEGTNIGFEFRWAEGNYDRLPHLVAELIATNVDVLIPLPLSGRADELFE